MTINLKEQHLDMSIVESFGPTAAAMGGSFFVGILIGYALKKVIKIVAIIVGLFLAGLAYLQYQQIANITSNSIRRYYYNTFKCNYYTEPSYWW